MTRFKLESVQENMSDSNETLSLAPELPPTMDVSHETEDKPSRLSLDLTKDFSDFLSDDTDTDVDILRASRT